MDSKYPVVRSRSNKTPKSRSTRSASNDNFKKNEVYVERKATSSLLDAKEATIVQNTRKAPPRPRPGQKKFLSSVLTILSKSTASTQYPDVNDKNFKRKSRFKPRRLKNEKTEAKNTKTKYKSRILNQNIRNEEDFIILQSKRDIAQSSSNYSESSNVKWSDVEQANKEKTVYNEVLEGKKFITDEPEALAEVTKKDDKIYNLFIDLLETTFNMYNVNEYEITESNTFLEINEDVAKKLVIKTESNEKTQDKKASDKIEFNDYPAIAETPIEIKLSDHISKPKIKSKSFTYPRKRQTVPKSNSFDNKRSVWSKKKNLLSILKEQLKMDVTQEEPRTLYEALKVMLKNKQRAEKSLQSRSRNNFEVGRKNPECTFRRQNLFIRSKKRNKQDKVLNNPYCENFSKQDRSRRILKNVPSYKSIEVYGYNYEEPPKQQMMRKRIVFTYHSSPTVSDLDTLVKHPERSTSNFNFYCNVMSAKNRKGVND